MSQAHDLKCTFGKEWKTKTHPLKRIQQYPRFIECKGIDGVRVTIPSRLLYPSVSLSVVEIFPWRKAVGSKLKCPVFVASEMSGLG
jgi:hypothetical protein